MGIYRWQAIIKTADNIPENYITNSWAFEYFDSLANEEAVRDALIAFYQGLRADLFSADVAQNGHILKVYKLPGVKPNYPEIEYIWNFPSAPSGAGLPSEVALCLSFEGQRIPGQAQARKQGRVYLGPVQSVKNVSGRPTAALRNTISTRALALKDAVELLTDGAWLVWSPTNQTGSTVAGGWIDDAWDTQRRRGLQRTSKTTW